MRDSVAYFLSIAEAVADAVADAADAAARELQIMTDALLARLSV